jgi:hypothetical protein
VQPGVVASHFNLSFSVKKNKNGKFWSWSHFVVGTSYISGIKIALIPAG